MNLSWKCLKERSVDNMLVTNSDMSYIRSQSMLAWFIDLLQTGIA